MNHNKKGKLQILQLESLKFKYETKKAWFQFALTSTITIGIAILSIVYADPWGHEILKFIATLLFLILLSFLLFFVYKLSKEVPEIKQLEKEILEFYSELIKYTNEEKSDGEER